MNEPKAWCSSWISFNLHIKMKLIGMSVQIQIQIMRILYTSSGDPVCVSVRARLVHSVVSHLGYHKEPMDWFHLHTVSLRS